MSKGYKTAFRQHIKNASTEEKLQIYVELAVGEFHWGEFEKLLKSAKQA
jgi:hypothetical protein